MKRLTHDQIKRTRKGCGGERTARGGRGGGMIYVNLPLGLLARLGHSVLYWRSMTKSQLRKLLEAHELPQTVAARALEIDPRTMRRYIAGDLPVPKVVEWALLYFIAQRKGETS